jgi:hypothetical protein
MTGFNATKRKKSKEKMDEDKFYVKNGIVRRLNDKIPRTEAGCRFTETTEAIILKGARRAEFPVEICFLLASSKRCIVRTMLTAGMRLAEHYIRDYYLLYNYYNVCFQNTRD